MPKVEDLKRAQRRRSTLQLAILAKLREQPAPSVTALAQTLERHRSVISRSLKALSEEGLVSRHSRKWSLTEGGELEAGSLRSLLQRRFTAAAGRASGAFSAIGKAGLQGQINTGWSGASPGGAGFTKAAGFAPNFKEAAGITGFKGVTGIDSKWLFGMPSVSTGNLGFSANRKALERVRSQQVANWRVPLTDAGFSAIRRSMEDTRSRIFAGLQGPLVKVDYWRFAFPKHTPFDRLRRIREALMPAGLVPAPSMRADIIDELVEAYEAGATPEELCEMALARYDADDSARLASVVERLCDSPHFASREKTLREALEAHRKGLDSLPTFSLVPMIEGVLEPYVREFTGKKKLGHNGMAKEVADLPVYGAGIEGAMILVAILQARTYGKWSPGDDPKIVDEFAVVNRHMMAHGGLLHGTRLNTLRSYLILEQIAALLDAWDWMLDDFKDT